MPRRKNFTIRALLLKPVVVVVKGRPAEGPPVFGDGIVDRKAFWVV
jgi:hypothetical protein